MTLDFTCLQWSVDVYNGMNNLSSGMAYLALYVPTLWTILSCNFNEHSAFFATTDISLRKEEEHEYQANGELKCEMKVSNQINYLNALIN